MGSRLYLHPCQDLGGAEWRELLPRTRLGPDAEHRFGTLVESKAHDEGVLRMTRLARASC